MDTTVLIAIFVGLLIVGFFKRLKFRNYLPGPTGLPIIGYLPFMTEKPHVKLQQLSKLYGPVYQVRLGSKNVVILCDYESIKEAFADDDFMGRPPDLPFEFNEETIRSGILGLKWVEQRRFSIHILRDLGLGKSRMEEFMKEELEELLERLSKLKRAFMTDLLTPSTSNNIASLIFGKRLKVDDPKRKILDRALNEVQEVAGSVSWTTFFPWIRNFMRYFSIGTIGKLSRAIKKTKDYFWDEFKEHEATLDPGIIRDYIDGYLLEIKKKSNDRNTTFKKEILEDLAVGFFGAGSETVRITIDWLLLVAASYPEVQRRIQQEIADVLGSDRFPSAQDVPKMPYTEAAILEVLRWRTVIPLNIMRYTLKDTELNGYFIPKHSSVLAVIWAVHHNEKLWKDVDVYKPERFLSEDGKKVVKPEYFIPFSTGKRACPGITFAEREAFLYVAAILQKFNLSLPPGAKPDFEGVLGTGLAPKRQEICLEIR